MILENILEAIGKTPVVKFNRIVAELECDLYGKCEFFNAGGSIKDRPVKWILDDAEKNNLIKGGDRIIESSGTC